MSSTDAVLTGRPNMPFSSVAEPVGLLSSSFALPFLASAAGHCCAACKKPSKPRSPPARPGNGLRSRTRLDWQRQLYDAKLPTAPKADGPHAKLQCQIAVRPAHKAKKVTDFESEIITSLQMGIYIHQINDRINSHFFVMYNLGTKCKNFRLLILTPLVAECLPPKAVRQRLH